MLIKIFYCFDNKRLINLMVRDLINNSQKNIKINK